MYRSINWHCTFYYQYLDLSRMWCHHMASISYLGFICQARNYYCQIHAPSMDELQKKKYRGMEYWKCITWLYWWKFKYASNDNGLLQLGWLVIFLWRLYQIWTWNVFCVIWYSLHYATLRLLQVGSFLIYSKV